MDLIASIFARGGYVRALVLPLLANQAFYIHRTERPVFRWVLNTILRNYFLARGHSGCFRVDDALG